MKDARSTVAKIDVDIAVDESFPLLFLELLKSLLDVSIRNLEKRITRLEGRR